jgi:transcriptional regulator with XRE-family HTH domain
MTRDNGSRMSYVGPVTEFGEAVRRARKRLGWSQDDLAAELGIVRKTVSRWETGAIGEPQLSQLRQLIEVTGAPPEDLLRAVGLLPARDGDLPTRATLDEFADRELLAELQRRTEARMETEPETVDQEIA